MATALSALQRLAVYEEPNGSFATDHSGTPADFLDVPFIEGSAQVSLNRTPLDPQTVKQFRVDTDKTILGVKRASLSFQMLLAPTGIAANTSTSTAYETNSAQLRMLKAVFGGLRGNVAGSTVAAAPTSGSQFSVAAGNGTRFTAGSALLLNSQAREIESVTTDALVLKHSILATPTAADVIYNSSTVYVGDNPNTSLQFILEGEEADDRWVLQGGQCTAISFDFPINELPKLSLTFEFATWTALASAAITNATYTNFSPTYVFGEFLAQVTGTATRALADVQAVSYAPSFQFAPITSPNGVQGIVSWHVLRQVPLCTVQFTTLYEDLTWFTARDNRSDYHLALQIGNTAGGTVLVVCPTAQISDVQRVDNGGFASQQVTARARMDSDATNTATEIRRSGFRIHFL